MLDLVLAIKGLISPENSLMWGESSFWKLLLFTDVEDSVSVLHNVFANQHRGCKSNRVKDSECQLEIVDNSEEEADTDTDNDS